LSHPVRFIVFGVLFSILWSSASVAGKFGLLSAEPLTLFDIRFFIAGFLMLSISRLREKSRWPTSQEFVQLTIFGALNTTLYLGIFIIALKEVAAGISTLMLALNPLLISILTALWLGRKILPREWGSIALGMIGVSLATFPLLRDGHATVRGILLLVLSMLTYSFGAVYYSRIQWKLSRMNINGWQVLIGGILLLPLTLFFAKGNTQFDFKFLGSMAWLVLFVSIGAVQLWLHLLKEDAVKASLWLFLCPISGFVLATLILGEPLTLYTIVGGILVIASLAWGQMSNFKFLK
jgi:probable blue pigment (indigoidine) exporter